MRSTVKSFEAFAPATVANVSVGFDNLGLALNNIGDRVRVTKIDNPEVIIKSIECEDYIDKNIVEVIPKISTQNTSTAGLLKLRKELNLSFGFEVEIIKGIPLGSGLGGSSASAVAALVAANQLLPQPLTKESLLTYAIEGEAVASGAHHADNVGPCLFGGMTLIQPNKMGVIRVPLPHDLKIAVVYPGFRLDTKKAREVLPNSVSLTKHVTASGRFASFIASCYSGDLELMKMSLIDEIIEPERAHLIWGFKEVKQCALSNNAIGCSISGAGPSVFAICKSKDVENVCCEMKKSFVSSGLKNVMSWVSEINNTGAYIIK